MVVGEPTGSKMMRLQKGMLKVRLSCKGVACHSGYPHLGVSAIDALVEVLHAIKHRAWPSSEELGETTVNIGLMEGGQAANALAEASQAVAMFRLIGDPEEVLSVVKEISAEYDCTVEVTRNSHPDTALICQIRVFLLGPEGAVCYAPPPPMNKRRSQVHHQFRCDGFLCCLRPHASSQGTSGSLAQQKEN